MFRKRPPDTGISEYRRLLVHVNYLRELADRLGGTDREAVATAADLLQELGDHLKRIGTLK